MINDLNVMTLPSDTDILCLSWEDENKEDLRADFDRGKSEYCGYFQPNNSNLPDVENSG